jgi:hypothetical protein
MPRSAVIDPELTDADLARADHLLDLAPFVGVDPEALAYVQRRLVAHEREREGMLPSRRAEELDHLIVEDIEVLCLGIKRMMRAVERMPSA